MRLIGHGIDLIECARIAAIVERHGDHFMERVLTEGERAYCGTKVKPVPHIAGRFAAKEAVLKVLGTGWRNGIAWTDVEVVNDKRGAPHIQLHGLCRELSEQMGMTSVVISITHTENYAAASALAFGEGQ